MKTNLVLALMATCSVLTACGGFTSSVGNSILNPVKTTTLKAAQLDGVTFNKIQDADKIPGITSLSLKLTGKQAPFQYEISMTPKDLPERSLSGEAVIPQFSEDRSVLSILSSSVIVTLNADGNCVNLEVPNQNQTVFFRDVDTLPASIVLCK